MNAPNLLRGFIILLLLILGERSVVGQDPAGGALRVPPVGEVQQVELRLYAVEMSGQTVRSLGLGAEDNGGKRAAESPLLKNATAWDAALETAVRLGAARLISSPTLATVNGRAVELECVGTDFGEQEGKKAGPANTSIKWNVKPTLLGDDKVRIDFCFSRSRTDLTRGVATPAGLRPLVRLQEVQTGVEVPLSKPAVLGRLIRFESVPAPESKKDARASKKATDAPQETTTLLVVTANLIDAKRSAQPKSERK